MLSRRLGHVLRGLHIESEVQRRIVDAFLHAHERGEMNDRVGPNARDERCQVARCGEVDLVQGEARRREGVRQIARAARCENYPLPSPYDPPASS